MITIIGATLGAYVLIAALGWWFIVSKPKIGTRGRRLSFTQKMRIVRREGFDLAIICLAWLPFLILLGINTIRGPMDKRCNVNRRPPPRDTRRPGQR